MTSDLITRLSKLDGPSHEIDDLIWETLEPEKYACAHVAAKEGGYKDLLCGPAYTDSVDAAIALAERVLPGWHWSIYDTDGLGRCNAQIERPDFTGAEDFDGVGSTPAISLCIALLRAKEASKI